MNKVKTIGILTSGGDAPGMNAALRAIVRSAVVKGIRVVGIKRGYNGLIKGDIIELDLRSVSDIIHKGGTYLYTARCLEFKDEAGVDLAVETCKKFGIDGIIVIGGDGSFRGAADLSAKGIPCVGIPGTIDNDIAASDYTIGFNTALETICECVDKIRDTSQSHDRCSIVEVMGRDAGWLALESGIAVGATIILVKEIPFDFQKDVIDRINRTIKTGKKHFIIVVSEGLELDVNEFAKHVERETNIVTRATVLGYIQRGGSPSVMDRVMATKMGAYAVNLLEKGKGNRVVVMQKNKLVDIDIFDALAMKKEFDFDAYNMANSVNI
ncbi:MAG: 6-phosphofructokinase [Clostridia bacterium]